MTQKFLQDPAHLGVGYPIIGVNSAVFAVADAIYIDSNGFLAIAGTTSKVFGYSVDIITMASDNQTVAKICPKYIEAPGVRMAYTADQACTQTDIGAYADLASATTGAQTINLLAGSTGQFLVLGFDPDNDGTTTLTVVEVAEPQVLAFAQA